MERILKAVMSNESKVSLTCESISSTTALYLKNGSGWRTINLTNALYEK